MYTNPSFLPNTGFGAGIWLPLAAAALIFLGLALVRAARTFRKDEASEDGGSTTVEEMLDQTNNP